MYGAICTGSGVPDIERRGPQLQRPGIVCPEHLNKLQPGHRVPESSHRRLEVGREVGLEGKQIPLGSVRSTCGDCANVRNLSRLVRVGRGRVPGVVGSRKTT